MNFALYVANTRQYVGLTGDGKGPSTFLTSGEEDVDRAFPCLVPVSVKDPERATDLYQARYAIIHWGWSRSYGRSSSLYLFTPRMNYPLFHGMDFINTDRPEKVFASIPHANSDLSFSSLISISESSLDLIIAVLLDLLTSCLSD